ncbi:hypothetical protein MMK73_002862 [Providencia rettgeri]|uniref:hypothetical protein n=1 Tax=Providencia sp. TaxID=589 RepID=UPI0024AA6B8A|nr:hypothetical protein [Providencia rettgeri]
MMKNTLFARLFIGIALFTGATLFAQAADNTVLTEITPRVITHEYVQLHQRQQDDGDIESERETKELESILLQDTTNDRRFTGRQFNLNKKEK